MKKEGFEAMTTSPYRTSSRDLDAIDPFPSDVPAWVRFFPREEKLIVREVSLKTQPFEPRNKFINIYLAARKEVLGEKFWTTTSIELPYSDEALDALKDLVGKEVSFGLSVLSLKKEV